MRHVGQIDQDLQVIVSEHGLADPRGLSPSQRAKVITGTCAHPDCRPALADYVRWAEAGSYGWHSPVLPAEAPAWHQRVIETRSMPDQGCAAELPGIGEAQPERCPVSS